RPGSRKTSRSARRRASSTSCRASAGWSARPQKSSLSRIPAPAPVDVGPAEPAVDRHLLDAIGLARQHLAAERRERHLLGQELPRVAERRRRGKLLDQRDELRQSLPRPRIAEKRCLLARLARHEELQRPLRPVEQRLEQLPLGSRKA